MVVEVNAKDVRSLLDQPMATSNFFQRRQKNQLIPASPQGIEQAPPEKSLAASGGICQLFLMPTVLRVRGYQFYFYAEEGNEPPHIHVAKEVFDAKFWLSPARLAVNHGFRPHDLREIAAIIEEHATLILEKWNEFFRP